MIKRGRIGPWPKEAPTPEEIASRVSYSGSAVHKRHPFLGQPPAFRSDKTPCAHYGPGAAALFQDLLRRALAHGSVSDDFDGEFPKRVWAYVNGQLHEARLGGDRAGAYHGFPLLVREHWPLDPKGLLDDAPDLEIS